MIIATLFAKRILTPLIASKMVYKLEHKNDNKNGNNAIGNKNNIETKNKSV